MWAGKAWSRGQQAQLVDGEYNSPASGLEPFCRLARVPSGLRANGTLKVASVDWLGGFCSRLHPLSGAGPKVLFAGVFLSVCQPSATICPSPSQLYDAHMPLHQDVRDQQHCLSKPPVKIGQEFQHNFGILAVQISCRLIGQQNRWPIRDRSRRIPAGHDQQPTKYPAGPGCAAAGRNRPVRKMLQHLFQQCGMLPVCRQNSWGNRQSSICSEACEFICRRMVLSSPSSRFSPRQRMK